MRIASLFLLAAVLLTPGVGCRSVPEVAGDITVALVAESDDQLRVTITNHSQNTKKIVYCRVPQWGYEIWIESTAGSRVTSGMHCDENWYRDPPNISDSEAIQRLDVIAHLRKGKSISQTFRLSRALSYLAYEPTEHEVQEAMASGERAVTSWLLQATNPPMKQRVSEALRKENGPFRVKVRLNGIESNWIEIQGVEFEQSVHFHS